MSDKYETIIGVEVHVELGTKTKLFCGCKTDFGADANTQICPGCLAMPGTLPATNITAIEYAVRAALAMNLEIQEYSIFERKHYFYPDLPRGYQLSMYRQPLTQNGYLYINSNGNKKRIGIRRIHLEDDAAKLVHIAEIDRSDTSFVDFNRSCMPLIEIVSDPDLSSPEEMKAYYEKVKSILEYLGVSDCDMEKGHFRLDANVNVREKGNPQAVTERNEIKNLNSIRFAMRAVEYEVERHIRALENGETLKMETRLFDSEKGTTRAMREKEEAHDYHYYTDPDLGPIELSQEWIEEIRRSLPELPDARRERFMNEYKLSERETDILISSKKLADYYEACVNTCNDAKTVCNWVLNDLMTLLNSSKQTLDECKITPTHLAGMLELINKGVISGKIARTVFEEMFNTGKIADVVVKEKGLVQIADEGELVKIVEQVIAENPGTAQDYRDGKQKSIGFLVGQVMKATKGKANPQLVNKLLVEKL